MISFQTIILKFAKKGEKTGWTYIEVPADIARQLKPGNRKSFRVKGRLDAIKISGIALIPMGEGSFIMPLNAALRKETGKRHGVVISVALEEDKTEYKINADLLTCLKEDKDAETFFKSLAPSHQKYFSKWIESSRTDATYANRIAQTVNAMARKQTYSEMIRSLKQVRFI